MPAPDRKRFWRRLPWALAGSVVLWLVIRPGYNTVLTSTAQGLCRLFERPPVTQVACDGEAAIIGRSDMRADSGRLRYSLTQIHFNLIPALALVFAVPGWTRRQGWQRLASMLLLLAISHVLSLVWHVQFFFATGLGEWSAANYGPVAREVLGGLRYFFDIAVTFTLPLLLWVGFFHERVFALLGVER